MIEMKKVRVHYYAGESNYLGHGRQPIEVDYLISDPLDWDDLPEDGFEGPVFGDGTASDLLRVGGKYHLYAEMENPTLDDETASYDNLKASIIELAQKIGIDTDRLVFPYDEI